MRLEQLVDDFDKELKELFYLENMLFQDEEINILIEYWTC